MGSIPLVTAFVSLFSFQNFVYIPGCSSGNSNIIMPKLHFRIKSSVLNERDLNLSIRAVYSVGPPSVYIIIHELFDIYTDMSPEL